MAEEHVTPTMEFKKEQTTQAEGTMRAKAKMENDGRECTGNKSLWNLWDKMKSRVINDKAGEVGKDLSDLLPYYT